MSAGASVAEDVVVAAAHMDVPPKGIAGERRTSAARATVVLVLVTLMWGLSFPLVKLWLEAAEGCPGGPVVTGLTLIALRMLLALVILALFQPRLFLAPSRHEHAIGLLVGSAFCVGFTLQVLGLSRTTPALVAFLTSLAGAWVPLLAWLFLRKAVAPVTWLGIALGIGGVAVLGLHLSDGLTLGSGEWLTVLASVLFAVQILLLDRLGRTVRSAHLTVGFFAVTGIPALLLATVLAASGPGLTPWLAWLGDMLQRPELLVYLALMTIFSTVLSFHWMNTYQPSVSAERAALIYFLEPVFGSIFSVAWGLDPLSGRLLLGGVLILGGNMLVELPGWLRSWRSRPTTDGIVDPPV